MINLDTAPKNERIVSAMTKAWNKLREFRNPVICISGGSDSDIMLDLAERVGGGKQVTYVFFDTGMEFAATKNHLKHLESKYGVEIQRIRAKTPVPKGCKLHGQPFLSKMASDMIDRLQRHGFRWENEEFEILMERYPGCESALRWWCNANEPGSRFLISNNAYLKEFMVTFPPWYRISKGCCLGAKVETGLDYEEECGADVKWLGLRQAEGGGRAFGYESCFVDATDNKIAQYMPLFFWSNRDKEEYKNHYHIRYSDAYEVYGLDGTGCACCPYGSAFEYELAVAAKYEPKLYNAACVVFGDSYQYTRMYRAYRDKMMKRDKEFRKRAKEDGRQIVMNL